VSHDAFQRAVVDLTLDYRKSSALLHGDRDVLAGYDLTDRERTRLLSIVAQPGMSVHCSLSRGNRLEVIAGVFPMTCVLLEPILNGLIDELWREHRPSNYQLAGEEAAFADVIRRKRADGELDVEYLDEIFAYELACWEMIRRGRTRPGTADAEARVDFVHRPSDLLPPLSRLEAPPPDLPTGSYPAIVRLRDGGFEVELLTPP
jgi:hypothetical protein